VTSSAAFNTIIKQHHRWTLLLLYCYLYTLCTSPSAGIAHGVQAN
jgi:hypothetical protein